jgi:DNA-binding MarR family transcriptional regulator
MPQVPRAAKRLAGIEVQRSRNLRQLLLRASKTVNRDVVDGLHARGYTKLRATHTTLLSNIALAGGTITEAAGRAGITKQAMGRLATELQAAGYLRVSDHPVDARATRLTLTPRGERLMLDSLVVMEELERRYAATIGKRRFADLRKALETFVATCHQGPRRSTLL